MSTLCYFKFNKSVCAIVGEGHTKNLYIFFSKSLFLFLGRVVEVNTLVETVMTNITGNS